MRNTRIKTSLGLGVVAVAATLFAGCDVENPTAITFESADPLHLTRGAMYQLEARAADLAAAVFLASDEGAAGITYYESPDLTGDPSTYNFFERTFISFHQARKLAGDAVARAEVLNDTEVMPLAHANYGWILTRLAEIWGAQPFGDGTTHSREEILNMALTQFTSAIEVLETTDVEAPEQRLRALAGIARVHWQLGTDPADATHLEQARDAAAAVLAEDSEFIYEPFLARSNYLSGMSWGGYGPTESFANIPHPIPEDEEDPGVKFIDADELRLILAEAELLLGNLGAAKAAVKNVALLPVNNVGLGREPEDPPLTEAEIDALIDPLDADELMFVIEELRRENQYGFGRRNVGPNGEIFPIPLPPNA